MYTAPISVLQGNTIACATRLPVTSLSTSLPSFPSAHLLGIVQLQHRLPLAGMLKGANLHDRLGRALVVPAAATKATATSAKATAATTKATATTAATATAKATTRGACIHTVWVCETCGSHTGSASDPVLRLEAFPGRAMHESGLAEQRALEPHHTLQKQIQMHPYLYATYLCRIRPFLWRGHALCWGPVLSTASPPGTGALKQD